MENTILNTRPCETCKYVEKELKQGQLIYNCKAGKFVPNGDIERVCRQYEEDK